MSVEKNTNTINKKKYKQPDGGYGYLIALSVIVIYCITFMPMVTFGIVFGPFLQTFGDEASNTALVTGIYLAVQWFTGLIANPLLQYTSYRKVGILGAFLYNLGAFATVFVQNLYQFITFFAVVQAFGYGLMLPSMLTAFNLYFDKKKAVVYATSNIFVILIVSGYPALSSFFMNNYGFRGTLTLLAGISLHCIPAMFCLQPVKFHMKKLSTEINDVGSFDEMKEKKPLSVEQGLNLPDNGVGKQHLQPETNLKTNSFKCSIYNCSCAIGLKSITKSVDLDLFSDPVYINIAVGVACCISADYTFLSVFPLLLDNFHVRDEDATYIMTVFYISDVIGRALLSVLIAFNKIKCRTLILTGAILTIALRLLFVLNNTFWWIATFTALTGSTRCLFQTTFALIFGELYEERFVTAFSTFMVISGVISLSSGFLIGVVKSATQDNEMVLHFLSLMYALCAIPWLLELIYFKITKAGRSYAISN